MVEGGDGAIGRVEEVVPGAAQDLLRIETPAGERYVPFVESIIVSVDVEAARIVIDPPEGLLE
jgi:16S rRNA processing protein RimM